MIILARMENENKAAKLEKLNAKTEAQTTA
jgi:hypothetical protein